MKKTRDKIIYKVIIVVAVLGGVAAFLNSIVETQVSAADNSATNHVRVNIIAGVCTFSASTSQHTATVMPGKFIGGIEGDTVFTVGCNNPDGYVVYAVGASNDVEGTTDMIGSGTAANHNIPTGPAQSGDESNWSFKVHSATQGVTIQPPFDTENYTAIPSTRTAIVKRTAGASDQDQFNVSYGLYVSGSQQAGAYVGKVRYILFDPNTHGPIEEPTTMQDFGNFCASMKIGQSLKLTDTRDGNEYDVRKLKDGKCWMLENLRLGGDEPITLKPEDSDVSSEWVLPAGATSNFTNTNNDPMINVTFKDIPVEDSTYGQEYGVYYNWCAAIASPAEVCSTMVNNLDEAPDSVCPKGWRLPSRGRTTTVNEFQILYNAYNQDYATLTDTDGPELALSGSYSSNSQSQTGSYGYWWSSTSGRTSYAYILSFSASRVTTNSAESKNVGRSVRCITE